MNPYLLLVGICLWVACADAGRLPPGVSEQQLMACEKVKNLFPPCARFLQCNMNAVAEESRQRRKNHFRHCFRQVSPRCKNTMGAMRDSPEMAMCNPPRRRNGPPAPNVPPTPIPLPAVMPVNVTLASSTSQPETEELDEE